MPTDRLYLKDSYLKECEAIIENISDNKVILDKTIIHPHASGLVSDQGVIIYNNEELNIIDAIDDRENDNVIHILDKKPTFNVNEKVKIVINWNRRYKLMRMHTASHIIAALAYKKFNAMITGGEITEEYARDDYNINLSGDALKNAFNDIIKEANNIAKKAIEVKIYNMKKEEALKIEGIVKLLEREPPKSEIWRIVEIPGVDIQADGGPHVNNTSEIGDIELVKIENKGKDKKRVYFKVI